MRIPLILNAQSGKLNRLSDDVERSSERSDACWVASIYLSGHLCRHLIRFSCLKGDVAGPVEPVGGARAVQAGVGNA